MYSEVRTQYVFFKSAFLLSRALIVFGKICYEKSSFISPRVLGKCILKNQDYGLNNSWNFFCNPKLCRSNSPLNKKYVIKIAIYGTNSP